MLGNKRVVLLFYLLLIAIDLYSCFKPWHEFSAWLGPLEMLVLLAWILKNIKTSINSLYISLALIISGITDYLFIMYGDKGDYLGVPLDIIKNAFLIIILYKGAKGNLKYSKKLLAVGIIYTIVAIGMCYVVIGWENWLIYILSLEFGAILFFISLTNASPNIFKQMYLGFSLIILSAIFTRILLSDPRDFIEAISRFSYTVGSLAFVAGIFHIRLLPKPRKQMNAPKR